MRRLGNENWKGSLTSFPWRLDFEQISTSDKCLSALMLNWNQNDKSNNCAQTIKDDEDENERDWKGEAKEANRRLQEKKEEVSESLLKVSCLKSLFF